MDVHVRREGEGQARAPEPGSTRVASTVRRLADVVVAVVVLVVTLPIMIVAAMAIRVESAGPVIVRHARIGSKGRQFDMYRFRSTAHGADDPTRVGRVMRWASIDELPQLWNVVRGDMSLVGPRPVPPAGGTPGGSRSRDSSTIRVVPGLTGTWTDTDDPTAVHRRKRRHGRTGSAHRGGSDHRAG
jgi:O-antigen biosynthesis protein WbqP